MYLRIDEGFPTHRKTLALARILQNHEAGMFMLRLWTWAVRSSPNGDLTGTEATDIEAIVQYRGPAGACYAAMVSVGFVDVLPGSVVLHDWHDWTGADVEDLEADAKRKRIARRHTAGRCGGATGADKCPICMREASTGHPPDVRRMSRVVQTRPGQARPGQTRKKKEDPGEVARPPSLFDQLLGKFCETWSAGYDREPYTPTPADRSQLGRLLQALKSPEESAALPALFDAYLRDKDPFVADKQRHSLAYFCTSGGLNKYRTKPPAQPRARSSAQLREERNNAAAEAWLARGGGGNGRG